MVVLVKNGCAKLFWSVFLSVSCIAELRIIIAWSHHTKKKHDSWLLVSFSYVIELAIGFVLPFGIWIFN